MPNINSIKNKKSTSGFKWLLDLFFPNRQQKRPAQQDHQIKFDRDDVQRRWAEIQALSRMSGPQNFQSAVIQADKLLDYCLSGLYAPGETMGERLKASREMFRDSVSYQAAWDAHKARNQFVHGHDEEFFYHQAKAAMINFEKALRGLGLIK